MRMKCTVTSRGRTVNLKSASWKVHDVFNEDTYLGQIWFVVDVLQGLPEIGVIFFFFCYNYFYISFIKMVINCWIIVVDYISCYQLLSCMCVECMLSHLYISKMYNLQQFFKSVLPSFRCYTAQVMWNCITAVLHALYVDIKSHHSPVWSCCVNRSLTPPTSTHHSTARPSSADTAWTWSSPTVTRGNTHSPTHTNRCTCLPFTCTRDLNLLIKSFIYSSWVRA